VRVNVRTRQRRTSDSSFPQCPREKKREATEVCTAEFPPDEQKLKVEKDQSHTGIRENFFFGTDPDFPQLTLSLSVTGRLSKINADHEMQ